MSMIDNLRAIGRPQQTDAIGRQLHEQPDPLGDLETQIGSLLGRGPTEVGINRTPFSRPTDAEDLGRITAEAIKTSHEEVAKELHSLADELAANVASIELLKTNAEESMKMCMDIAERARERGKADAAQIEAAHNRNNEIRSTIMKLREKIEQ